jgi:preprotein translocase subunit SecF
MKNFFEWYEDKVDHDPSGFVRFMAFLLGSIIFVLAMLLFIITVVGTYGATLLLAPVCLYIWYRKDKGAAK